VNPSKSSVTAVAPPFEYDEAPSMTSGFQNTRTGEEYGDAALSIQAGATMYCRPRVNGLRLSEYESVEIAVVNTKAAHPRDSLVRPSALGIEGFDDLFESGNGPVAGYVPLAKVHELRAAMRARAEAQA
jgi:hypothetical protein